MSKEADKAFSRLDRPIKQRVIKFFEERILPTQKPQQLAKPLTENLSGYWSFRIGNYRAICDIRDCTSFLLEQLCSLMIFSILTNKKCWIKYLLSVLRNLGYSFSRIEVVRQ